MLAFAAKDPYRECVLIITPRKSARPQLCSTLATASEPTSSTSDMMSVSMMIDCPPWWAVKFDLASVGTTRAMHISLLIWLGFILVEV